MTASVPGSAQVRHCAETHEGGDLPCRRAYAVVASLTAANRRALASASAADREPPGPTDEWALVLTPSRGLAPR